MYYAQESYEVTCTPVFYIPAACTFKHLPPNVYTCIPSTDKTSSGVYGSPVWNLYKAGDRIIEQEFALTMSIKNYFNWNETYMGHSP